MTTHSTRRQFFEQASQVALGTGILGAATTATAAERTKRDRGFSFCLNTSTIRGQKLGLVQEIELAAAAGYDAIEPWTSSIHQYAKEGGSLADLRKRIQDLGLTVAGAIAFSQWIADDDSKRAQGLEQAKLDMEALAQIGGRQMAAPPAGAQGAETLDLLQAAERYRALLDLGQQTGVRPMLEVWGFSNNLHRLGQALFVAIESGHPQACVLPDVYHIYKGGSDFTGLRLLGPAALPMFHINDYPADPPRDTIKDQDRVMPGDGVAPLTDILRMLQTVNPGMILSLELFSPAYWQQDARRVAEEGLVKMKAAVGQALG